MLPTILRQVETGHTSKLDTQRLQENGEEIREQDNEKQRISELCTSSHIGGIISGINVSNSNQEPGAHEARKFDKTLPDTENMGGDY
jgi:hypothetical protein